MGLKLWVWHIKELASHACIALMVMLYELAGNRHECRLRILC